MLGSEKCPKSSKHLDVFPGARLQQLMQGSGCKNIIPVIRTLHDPLTSGLVVGMMISGNLSVSSWSCLQKAFEPKEGCQVLPKASARPEQA